MGPGPARCWNDSPRWCKCVVATIHIFGVVAAVIILCAMVV